MRTSLFEVPDVELMGYALDLGRPELEEVMTRYSRVEPQPDATLVRAPAALVVTNHPGDDRPVRAALQEDGWLVQTCAGPAHGDCPLMRGEPCDLRSSVDAAVVFVEASTHSNQAGALPRLRCAADRGSPAVVAVESSVEPTRFSGSTACVGALRGPDAILSAISALLTTNHE